ncbi:MAG: hypothetical protein K9H64_16705 [Bacteroidales bacterium]|nr:hypothetical protein [Bacteroidales bacterium]MCF8454418.1 hypothetical protein [Bacteroidales bacterium]
MRNIPFLVILFFLFASCQLPNKHKHKASCGLRPVTATKNLMLDFGIKIYKDSTDIWSRDSIDLAILVIDDEKYKDVCSSFNKLTQFPQFPYIIVVYANKSIVVHDSISLDEVIGISYYYLNSKKLFHTLFKRQGNSFISDDELSCESGYISSNDIFKIASSRFLSDANPYISWILISPRNGKELNLPDPQNNLMRILSLE